MKTNKREKLILAIGACIVGFLTIYFLIIGPSIKRSAFLDKDIEKKTKAISKMEELKEVFIAQQKAIDKINKNINKDKRGFKIITFLSETAKKVGIGKNITQMKPRELEGDGAYKESSVELKVDGIELNQLVDYLYKIENSNKIINIKNLRLSPKSKDKNKLDVKIEVSTFELKKKS